MGCQTPTSSDRSRTYWTPTMEHYFIDLLLDHMHRGNRIGHTFNKQAWTDMVTVFNAKFGSQYDKDVLKSRYTSLWKQFNDIKNLLDQSGFSWDDAQQMVVADDYVWDAYIKAYPDAQYYRNKAVMNFNDLWLIYAYTTADGRYSRSSHDIDFDDDMQGVNIGGGKESQPTGSNCSKTYWTPPMDHYFIDLLLDQVRREKRIGHAFLTQAWIEMVTLFNAKFGSQFDKEVLKNHYKHLRQQYNEVKILLDHDGFFWDETREMVTAEDYVWDSYTKAFPNARSYKFKTVPSYHKLCVIYGKESSNGRCSRMAHNDEDLNGEDPLLMIEEKDIQCNAHSNYSRTDWTPSMDRYLIDLMLKQVHKQHGFNHIFDEQAWINIVASFNDRFGSQHNKYVLRGRHKSLRKLYIDMKNLLNQSNFSCDETQQMVTACDDAWDAYNKEQPDGKSFRTKSKPNYNDLCVIYGNSTSDGRCNQSDQNGDFNGDGGDIQALQNGSCLRTGWTPPMDRYFIDLMLEQIRRGTMVDQKFNKQAWCDMIAKFNAKFGSHYHQDVLKSRFENLGKQFNDMKTLLDQSGFAWDEMQQMITANEDLWDAYIKEHPDSHSYRCRTLPNYNDLFLIYGNAIAHGRHDCSSYCVDVDDYVLGVNFGQEDDRSSAGSDTPRIDWTKPMDRYFIDLMLEQVLEGNKIDHTFNKQAWVRMITSFNEKFGLQCGKCVLENRYLSLMRQYNNISNLLNQKCFVWDETQQTVTADNGVWEAYIKDHPDAAMYKDKVLETYSNLSLIFGNGIHDGGLSFLGPEMDIDHTALEMGMDGIIEGLQSPGKDITISNQRKKRRSATPLPFACSRKVKKTSKEGLQEAGRSNTQGKIYSSIESIVDALQAIPDMDDELFLDACDLLEDEKKAKAFVKMDIPHRKKWLSRKLCP
uniref:Myb/SANT-like domain-containing protein n=1 Tax=Davidia involucrata TaxID=16924 RepID=A0A5B6YGW0_DAVIN